MDTQVNFSGRTEGPVRSQRNGTSYISDVLDGSEMAVRQSLQKETVALRHLPESFFNSLS